MNFKEDFLTGHNYFISLDYKKAYHFFLDKYYKYPQEMGFFHSLLVSMILLDQKAEIKTFLERESQISSMKKKIIFLQAFIRDNDYFEGMKNVSIIYNIGLFLKINNLADEAKIYFDVCLLLNPKNRKVLTIMSEYALLENNADKCISYLQDAIKIK